MDNFWWRIVGWHTVGPQRQGVGARQRRVPLGMRRRWCLGGRPFSVQDRRTILWCFGERAPTICGTTRREDLPDIFTTRCRGVDHLATSHARATCPNRPGNGPAKTSLQGLAVVDRSNSAVKEGDRLCTWASVWRPLWLDLGFYPCQ